MPPADAGADDDGGPADAGADDDGGSLPQPSSEDNLLTAFTTAVTGGLPEAASSAEHRVGVVLGDRGPSGHLESPDWQVQVGFMPAVSGP